MIKHVTGLIIVQLADRKNNLLYASGNGQYAILSSYGFLFACRLQS